MSRLRQWYSEETKKLKQMTPRESLSYVLSYYWLHILILTVLIFVPVYLIIHILRGQPEYKFYAIFANTMQDAGNGSAIWHDFADYAEIEHTSDELYFDAQCYFEPSKNPAGDHYFTTFIVLAETGTLDVITMSREELVSLSRSGRLLNLNDPSCEQIREKYQDRLVYGYAAESEEEIPIGIDLSNSRLVSEYGVYSGDCAAGLGLMTSHPERILAFLDFVTGSENR